MIAIILVSCLMIHSTFAFSRSNSTKRNVLVIIADDLRPEIAIYHDEESQLFPNMFTPNMDLLARRSAIFRNAHVQYALCGPSRTSFLTSRRPHTTSVFMNNANFRNTSNANMVTLPELFKENGYRTLGGGKVFHGSVQDYPTSWDEPVFVAPNGQFWQRMRTNYIATEEEIKENPLPDTQIADYAIKTLTELAPKALSGEEPFFLAVGFVKPHLNFLCPERLLKHYPTDKVKIADNQFAPNNFPAEAWYHSDEFKRLDDIRELSFTGEMNETLPSDKAIEIRRSYYCTVSHVDEELGRVLNGLEELGLEESTVVTFSGDHGWQLGEHSQWGKQTNFYLSTRTPLMLHVPGVTKGTEVISDLVEFVDLMPTLAEAAGLSAVPPCPEVSPASTNLCTEGSSLLPLLRNHRSCDGQKYYKRQRSEREKNVAHTQYLNGNMKGNEFIMEYSVHDERYRYSKTVGNKGAPGYLPEWSENKGEQLYDRYFDPDENVNVAYVAGYREIRKRMEGLLRAGFPN